MIAPTKRSGQRPIGGLLAMACVALAVGFVVGLARTGSHSLHRFPQQARQQFSASAGGMATTVAGDLSQALGHGQAAARSGDRGAGITGRAQQFFSPEDDLEGVWVQQIQAAQKDIHIACYGLSDPVVGAALSDAVQRGVEVIVLEDRRQSRLRSDLHDQLAAAGAHIVLKRSNVLLHDKLGIFDGQSAIVGSYNLSKSAEEQDNSLVLFRGMPDEASRDETAWEVMFRREVGHAYSPGMSLPPEVDRRR